MSTVAPATTFPRVLVVDDELGPRESLRMLLKPAYHIQTAENGRAALDALEWFRPDVVIMDIKMPELDGLELLRRVKSVDPTIEVIMITAYASLETVKHALTNGAFEYLIKPFARQDLEDVVRRALLRRHAELGARGEVTRLVEEMRQLASKTGDLEEAARREDAERSLRVAQLSILREMSRTIVGQLDPDELAAGVSAQLKTALGYDRVMVTWETPTGAEGEDPRVVMCTIRDPQGPLGALVVDNRASGRPIDPRERELLEMLSEYLAIALRNSRLYGEIADTKRSLEKLIASAGRDHLDQGRRPHRRLEPRRRAHLPARVGGGPGPVHHGRPAGGRVRRRQAAAHHGDGDAPVRGLATVGAAGTPHRARRDALRPPRAARRARGRHRDRPRHHHAARGRAAAPPVREAHGPRAARGGDVARLQQRAPGDPWLRAAREAEPQGRRVREPLAQYRGVGGARRLRDGAAHPDVRAPPTRRAVRRGRRQPDREGRGGAHPAPVGGEDCARSPARPPPARGGKGGADPRPARRAHRADDEPDPQRPRRHARRGHAHDRHPPGARRARDDHRRRRAQGPRDTHRAAPERGPHRDLLAERRCRPRGLCAGPLRGGADEPRHGWHERLGVRRASPRGRSEGGDSLYHRLGAPRGRPGTSGQAQGPPLPLQAGPAQRPRRCDPGGPGLAAPDRLRAGQAQENAAGVVRALPLSA